MQRLLIPLVLVLGLCIAAWVLWFRPNGAPIFEGSIPDPSIANSSTEAALNPAANPTPSADGEAGAQRVEAIASAELDGAVSAPAQVWFAAGKVVCNGVGLAEVQVLGYTGFHGYWYDSSERKPSTFQAITDADGSFQLPCPARFVQLLVERDGFVAKQYLDLDFKNRPRVEGLQLEMFVAEICQGQIVAEGVGVADATVRASTQNSWQHTRLAEVEGASFKAAIFQQTNSDIAGNFQFSLPEDLYRFSASLPENGGSGDEVYRVPDDRVILELKKPLPKTKNILHGMVIDTAGKPVSRCLIEGKPYGPRAPVSTGKDGSFTIEGIDDGYGFDEYLVAFDQKHAPIATKIDHSESGLMVITLPDPQTISGRVVDQNDQPIANAAVFLDGEPNTPFPANSSQVDRMLPGISPWQMDHPLDRAQADADGNFQFQLLPPGEYTLFYSTENQIYRQEYSNRSIVRAHSGDRNVVLKVGEIGMPSVNFHGLVVHGHDHQPLAGVEVTANSVEGSASAWSARPHATAVTDHEGRYQCVGVLPGDYELEYRLDGFARRKTERIPYSAGSIRQDMELVPERRVVISVIDVLGRPLENAAVAAKDKHGDALSIPIGRGGLRNYITTNTDGKAVLESMPGERISLFVSLAADIEGEKLELDLSGPHPHEYSIQLKGQAHPEYQLILVQLQDASGAMIQPDSFTGQTIFLSSADLQAYPVDQKQFLSRDGAWWTRSHERERETRRPTAFLRVPASGGTLKVVVDGHSPTLREIPALVGKRDGAQKVKIKLNPDSE
jgi:hypothetical protein